MCRCAAICSLGKPEPGLDVEQVAQLVDGQEVAEAAHVDRLAVDVVQVVPIGPGELRPCHRHQRVEERCRFAADDDGVVLDDVREAEHREVGDLRPVTRDQRRRRASPVRRR